MAHELNPRQPRNHADFIWSVANLLRGDYKRSEYGKVILPLTVLRRLDGVLASTKQRVLEKHKQLQGRLETMDPVLNRITGVQFNNTSVLELRRVLDDPPNVADQLRQYVAGFSGDVRDIFEKFELDAQIARLEPALSGARQVRGHRPRTGERLQHRDGLSLRGADPPLLGALQRLPQRELTNRQHCDFRRVRAHPPNGLLSRSYSPKCVEGKFCEPPTYGVSKSSLQESCDI